MMSNRALHQGNKNVNIQALSDRGRLLSKARNPRSATTGGVEAHHSTSDYPAISPSPCKVFPRHPVCPDVSGRTMRYTADQHKKNAAVLEELEAAADTMPPGVGSAQQLSRQ
ncbi:hypothetical protein NDU88_000922 [Pleurodeles waltl]|uniref:Uncharacterized protein n=1 Tax=Pleurodeles waltl TaxID=8319 RepID=A0AAV7WJD2_PLEWA|nr:hypothetical protein NDU88_000922 [Pleurodeles waltl]